MSAEEIAFEISHFPTYQTFMTLTLDQVMRHTVVCHLSTSVYTPNVVHQIGKTVLTDGRLRTDGRTVSSALLGRLRLRQGEIAACYNNNGENNFKNTKLYN